MTSQDRKRRVSGVLNISAVVLVAVALGFSLFSPRDVIQGDLTRMLYVHVPSIITAYLAFGLTTFATIVYLVRRDLQWDRWAAAAAEIGVVFLGLAIVTGMIWGKPVWGVWWTWDARLTSTALMFFIYPAVNLASGLIAHRPRKNLMKVRRHESAFKIFN